MLISSAVIIKYFSFSTFKVLHTLSFKGRATKDNYSKILIIK